MKNSSLANIQLASTYQSLAHCLHYNPKSQDDYSVWNKNKQTYAN